MSKKKSLKNCLLQEKLKTSSVRLLIIFFSLAIERKNSYENSFKSKKEVQKKFLEKLDFTIKKFKKNFEFHIQKKFFFKKKSKKKSKLGFSKIKNLEFKKFLG